jgi:hypothetical protein
MFEGILFHWLIVQNLFHYFFVISWTKPPHGSTEVWCMAPQRPGSTICDAFEMENYLKVRRATGQRKMKLGYLWRTCRHQQCINYWMVKDYLVSFIHPVFKRKCMSSSIACPAHFMISKFSLQTEQKLAWKGKLSEWVRINTVTKLTSK